MSDDRSWFRRQVFDVPGFCDAMKDAMPKEDNVCTKTYVGNWATQEGIKKMTRKGWKVQHVSTRTSGWLLKRGNTIVVYERDE
jgi:hypothetical protein